MSRGIKGFGDKSHLHHHDTCTVALCLCGLDDGVPRPVDYEAAGQPLPGFGKRIDFGAVLEAVEARLGFVAEPTKAYLVKVGLLKQAED